MTGRTTVSDGYHEDVAAERRARWAAAEAPCSASLAAAPGIEASDEAGIPDLARPGDDGLEVGMHDVLAAGAGSEVRPARLAEDHPDQPAASPASPVVPSPARSEDRWPAGDPRITTPWQLVRRLPLPVTTLHLEDGLVRCATCGYVTARCACAVEYRGGSK